METKVQRKVCNVNSFSYDEDKKILIVNYKFSKEGKIYNNFPKESYEKILKLNQDKKTIGLTLREEIKKIK